MESPKSSMMQISPESSGALASNPTSQKASIVVGSIVERSSASTSPYRAGVQPTIGLWTDDT